MSSCTGEALRDGRSMLAEMFRAIPTESLAILRAIYESVTNLGKQLNAQLASIRRVADNESGEGQQSLLHVLKEVSGRENVPGKLLKSLETFQYLCNQLKKVEEQRKKAQLAKKKNDTEKEGAEAQQQATTSKPQADTHAEEESDEATLVRNMVDELAPLWEELSNCLSLLEKAEDSQHAVLCLQNAAEAFFLSYSLVIPQTAQLAPSALPETAPTGASSPQLASSSAGGTSGGDELGRYQKEMFTFAEKHRSVNPEHLDYFRFVGRVIAKAIYDNKQLDCYFTRAFYKHILNKHVRYQDIESEDPDLFKSLEFLLNNAVEDLGAELTFTVEVEEFGVRSTRQLLENGNRTTVTDANKHEYVHLMCQMKMKGSIRQQLNAFLDGFYEVIPKKLISIFNEQELELLVSGLPDIDIDDLCANTEYKTYTRTSPQIQWFWRALKAFDAEDKAKFLQFVTGTSKVPLQGFAHLEGMNGVQKFTIQKDTRSNNRLPSAHTCFNQLDLPEYPDYETLHKMLLLASRECSEGFAFAARSARLGEHAKTEQVVGRDGGRRKQSDERHRRLTAGARRAPANQSTACGSRADFFRSP
ncbi:hypothetical protein niasHS_013423 [Heterodera schachtii]|uniref:HECT-type E3 ubiquitin transferase n=1 Tax=Heterodera schachtii TaxID=97005 RepID=A0ABD2IC72_HETSC